MTNLEVKYRNVIVPDEYHNNLDSPGFAHWKRGVESALDPAPDQPEFEYYSDQDAEPHTYFRRIRPGDRTGQALFGRGRNWESDEISRDDFITDYDYVPIKFQDMPGWARLAVDGD